MGHVTLERLDRALVTRRPRRQAAAGLALALLTWFGPGAAARRRDRAQRAGFSRKCRRFVVSAGPARDERFQHIDDDLTIEVLPKRGGAADVVFEDDNDAPNGDNGSHPKGVPFAAKVGDKIRIVARNEVAGGCELDEIWLHCMEGRGGRVKLTDRITPEQCSADADEVGVFFDQTIRIKNK